jgi:small nuclear ribonucleoprotein E
MAGRGGGGRRVLLPPIQYIFKLLQQRTTVRVWLYEQLETRVEGKITGFDEFMNLVLEDAIEIKLPSKTRETEQRKKLGWCWKDGVEGLVQT